MNYEGIVFITGMLSGAIITGGIIVLAWYFASKDPQP